MTDDYEYYKAYDEDARGEIKLKAQILDWLWTADLMLEFVKTKKPEIFETFLEMVEGKYISELEQDSYSLSDVGFDIINKDDSILALYPKIKDFSLQIILKHIPLAEGFSLSDENESIRYIDYLRAKHILLYHRITTLVEILGREKGIEFYKDFVQFWAEEFGKKHTWEVALRDVRKNAVKFWRESGGFEFGVIDIDEDGFLAKFDKCVWHESMKHVEDQELAYYAVCYPGPRLGKYAHQNILLRRSVTLFTGDFCDELRWDRHVHHEPEQPSHEFSKRIVPK